MDAADVDPANQDADVGDRHRFVVQENHVCRAGIQRAEDHRAVALSRDIHDVRISGQDGLIGTIEQKHRTHAELQNHHPVGRQ